MRHWSSIYLDNIRGFQDTRIDIFDVNFLIGENSTGKTSFLKLLEILTSQEFWLSGAFRNTNVDLGYYGDLSDIGAGKSTIGLLGRKPETDISIAFEIVASNNDQTDISAIKYLNGSDEISIRWSKTGIGYKYRQLSDSKIVFNEWAKAGVDKDGFTDSKNNIGRYGDKSPYFSINSVLRQIREDGTKKIPTSSFYVMDEFFRGARWVAPIRVEPRKTYDENVYSYSPDGAHMPYMLKQLIYGKSGKTYQNFKKKLEKFGQESGLFDEILVRSFGKGSNMPFAIEVRSHKQTRHLLNVGYGVSQVLPIVLEIINSKQEMFLIQQPEVHLHPKAQASLGTLLYESAINTENAYLIETHSDFIIDRFRQRISSQKTASKNNLQSQILFFENKNDFNTVSSIAIEQDGKYSEDQPDSFRDFFYKEELNNLKI